MLYDKIRSIRQTLGMGMKEFTDFEIECIVYNEKISTRRSFKRIMRKEIISRKLANLHIMTNKYNSPSRYCVYFNGFSMGLTKGLSLYT